MTDGPLQSPRWLLFQGIIAMNVDNMNPSQTFKCIQSDSSVWLNPDLIVTGACMGPQSLLRSRKLVPTSLWRAEREMFTLAVHPLAPEPFPYQLLYLSQGRSHSLLLYRHRLTPYHLEIWLITLPRVRLYGTNLVWLKRAKSVPHAPTSHQFPAAERTLFNDS